MKTFFSYENDIVLLFYKKKNTKSQFPKLQIIWSEYYRVGKLILEYGISDIGFVYAKFEFVYD